MLSPVTSAPPQTVNVGRNDMGSRNRMSTGFIPSEGAGEQSRAHSGATPDGVIQGSNVGKSGRVVTSQHSAALM